MKELLRYIITFNTKKLFKEKTDNTFIQFFRYLFVGGFAAIVNIGMLFIFTDLLHLYYIMSNVLSFVLGLIVNYLLSKKFVFQEDTSISQSKEFVMYTIIGVIGLGIDTMFVWLFTDIIKIYYMISKLISTAIVFIWNFGARKILYRIIK
jgi:putative flippase GtrA